MKRTLIALAVCSLVLLTAATVTSTAWSGLKGGPVAGRDEKRKDTEKALTGEIAIEVNCPVGQLGHGEVEFPRELPKVPMIFLMENRQTGAVVVNSQTQIAIFECRTNPNHTGIGAARDSMSQCVFGERLQNQIRHEGARRSRMDVVLKTQPIGKSHLLNTQIQLDEVDFFSQFNFVL